MFKNKLHTALGLMMITIVVIIFFQLFWLQKSYNEQKQVLEKQTNILFRETIFSLQAGQLQNGDSLNIKYNIGSPDNIVGVTSALQKRYKTDSDIFISRISRPEGNLINDTGHKKSMQSVIISVHDSANDAGNDIQMYSNREVTGGRLFNFLLEADSLQDTLNVKDVTLKVDSVFRKAGFNLPFTLQKKQSNTNKISTRVIHYDLQQNQVPVGFLRPYILQLTLGNTFNYLIKKMVLPVSFSLFLIGVTILSFLFLYRSLLEQNKLNEHKNDFISNITHELKTPVATVGVAIEALKNFNASGSAEKIKDYLDISGHELQRLSMLIDKVLKLSMVEQKEIELKNETTALKEITEKVAASMQLLLEKYNATLHIHCAGDMCVWGDKLHLQGVVFNLLDNALKYSVTHPVIIIEIKEMDDKIVFTVADNGIGIAQEYKRKVFEKFFRVPAGDAHDSKGYGLGLSYVKQIVEKHRGTIQLESKPGKGSKFTIVFPKLKL